jgi:hypothetical protein
MTAVLAFAAGVFVAFPFGFVVAAVLAKSGD